MRKQPSPGMDLPEAFLIGEEFIGDDSVALILGDNIYHGPGLIKCFFLQRQLRKRRVRLLWPPSEGSVCFGVVEFDTDMNAISIEENRRISAQLW